jgi:WD40 repeat protein
MRFFFLFLSMSVLLCASDIVPRLVIEASGNVQSIAMQEGKIVAGTNAGSIDVYAFSDGALLKKIVFEKIKDFTGEMMAPKVFSVDALQGSETYVAVVQASSGARRLVLVDNGVTKEIISAEENLFLTKAQFIDKNRILVALMSNELLLIDAKTAKKQYQVQINPSHFSDFVLNESKSLVASSCESGEITLSDVATGKTLKVFSGGNVDNVYKVDFKNQKILGAGQDRRGIVYDTNSKAFDRFDAPFLIYAGALSPSAKLGAFAFNEENDIVLFDLHVKTKLHTLKGQKSTLNTIVFVNEKELVSGSDDKFILLWRLP